MYLGKTKNAEGNLGGSVTLALTECTENTECTFFSNNFFISPLLITKFSKVSTHLGLLEQNRKNMIVITADKNLKRDDHELLFSKTWVAANGLITDQLQCCSVML